jgi:hypothetical protein
MENQIDNSMDQCKTTSKTRRKWLHKGEYRGPLHHAWKGDNITPTTGHKRAIQMYPMKPCEVCGREKTERHHKDGNALNNSPENIRFLCHRCHMTEDGRLDRLHEILRQRNSFVNSGEKLAYYKPRAKPPNSKSKFKGVNWNKTSSKWEARISIRGKGKYLGSFEREEDAAKAYQRAVKAYFWNVDKNGEVTF